MLRLLRRLLRLRRERLRQLAAVVAVTAVAAVAAAEEAVVVRAVAQMPQRAHLPLERPYRRCRLPLQPEHQLVPEAEQVDKVVAAVAVVVEMAPELQQLHPWNG